MISFFFAFQHPFLLIYWYIVHVMLRWATMNLIVPCWEHHILMKEQPNWREHLNLMLTLWAWQIISSSQWCVHLLAFFLGRGRINTAELQFFTCACHVSYVVFELLLWQREFLFYFRIEENVKYWNSLCVLVSEKFILY